MISAGILIIGNEILSGRTKDINSNFLCLRCSDIGIKVQEIRVIEDDIKIISKTVLAFSKKYNYVFVTGGIGPTHDDKTAEAVAKAFKRKIKINKKAKKLLEKHYENSEYELNESRMKMAKIPLGARLINNPVSAAPGFKIQNVWVMAGVPKIMQAMFLSDIENKLKKDKAYLSLEIIVFRPEGDIAEILQELQSTFKLLDVGSYPFYKPPNIGTNIILRGKDKVSLKKASNFFCKVLKKNGVSFNINN